MVTDLEISEIKAKINPVIGKKAWEVSLGYGSFITMNFGNKTELNDGHGEWYLWIYCCSWQLENTGKILATSDDLRTELKLIVQCMENQTLNSVEIVSHNWETTFNFSDNITLRTSSFEDEEYEHWRLYAPDGNVLSIGPSHNWSYDGSSNS
jgi:hypothetical protein